MTARTISILAALTALAFATPALAGHHESKERGKPAGKMQEHGDKAMKRGDEAREEADERTREAREEADERTREAREEAEESSREAREEAGERSEGATKGRGAEMRARRDERKAIMDEAKSAAEPGTPRKGKKPWWRFWESDEVGEAAEE